MNFRGVLRPARSRITLSAIGQQHGLVDSTYAAHQPTIFKRGAKRKTTVKLDTLVQGVLPALPKLEADLPPEKVYPPVLQQHLNNVRKFSDCIVLTRVGDFYEMYFDQVDQYAHLVNLKKAKRATVLGDVAMAGFQASQLDRYLKMFVQDHGKQVAISEQIRLPESQRIQRAGAPMYDRKVTRIVTAGTLIDENFMDPFEDNYLLGVHIEDLTAAQLKEDQAPDHHVRTTKVGLSWVDLSSGDFYTQSSDLSSLSSIVARIGPREIVLDASFEELGSSTLERLLGDAGHSLHFQVASPSEFSIENWTDLLESPIPKKEQAEFTPSEVAAGSLILEYVRGRLIDTSIKLQPPVRRSAQEYMVIDKQSLRGLEIRQTLKDGLTQGSLLQTIRRTVTKSGARLLNQRLVSPSLSLAVINNRLDLVQELRDRDGIREDIQGLLRRTYDTSRLLQRFCIGKGDADDMLGLAKTIAVVQQISDLVHIESAATKPGQAEAQILETSFLENLFERLDLTGPTKVAKTILSAIDEEGLSRKHQAEIEQATESGTMAEQVMNADAAGTKPPKLGKRASKQSAATVTPGNSEPDIWIMRKDASSKLSKAHKDLDTLLIDKQALATSLREKTKSDSLTLRWSGQLGHFCHVKGKDAKGNLDNLPDARSIASTKTTRTFHINEWTHLGASIDDAKLRIRAEEDRVFNKLRVQVLENLMRLRHNAAILDELDVAASNATIAKERNLTRPILNTSTAHRIIGGRHPTVDVGLRSQGRNFTANDCLVGDDNKERLYLITGPNMAGKSTYLRQNALITILAQTGAFVPAEYAELGLVDKIFSRVGSADNLYQDQSTFMVEMLETAEILRQATSRSFVIMDEVGRGTTAQDGFAVGYACLRHLKDVNGCRALFATHFHGLADRIEGLGCFCTDVEEGSDGDGSWSYVHKLRRGVNRESHALKVAKMAGLPAEAIRVAGEVLRELREGEKRV
jgi:DNA mismatch repair ATPase MutS